MNFGVQIRTGQKLTTRTGVAFCRLGAIVVDAEGRLLGLTARHILEGADGGDLFDAATGAAVGTADLARADLADGADFLETIGVITLQGVTVDDGDPLTASLAAVDPASSIGLQVFKRQSDCADVPGVLEGFGGSIEFEDPATGRPTLLRDVIEISFGAEDGATDRGEAGSPVFAADGLLVGILMAGSPERAYAAPVAGFLAKYGYRLYRPDRDGSEAVEDTDDELTLELRNAAFGATQLRRDITAENERARDPYDEVLPDRLADLLVGAD